MNRTKQWLFEVPLVIPEDYTRFKPESEWGFSEYEYTPSSVRRAFENAVKVGNWRIAYLNLNGLNMYEMLRALDNLPAVTLTTLWANHPLFMSLVNMPRIDYARKVVLTRRLPSPVGDLQRTGQVQDATNFIRQHPRKRKPKPPASTCNVGGQVSCEPPKGLNEAEITALKITTRFENNREFGCRVSQVDGISMGMIQWNLKAGTLQKMLKDFDSQTRGGLQEFFGADTAELRSLIKLSTNEAVEKAKREKLCFRWSHIFLRLCADPRYCSLQVKDIRSRLSSAQAVTKRLGLRTIRGVCIIFDILVGDGLSSRKEQGFANRIRGLSTEQEKLIAIADEAARWAGNWENERRQRRMLIAKGTGCYRGHCKWNLDQNHPNLDNLLQN